MIIAVSNNLIGYFSFLQPHENGKHFFFMRFGGCVAGLKRNRLLVERPFPQDEEKPKGSRARGRAARSVTVNLAESPLGWLRARRLVSERQFAAGEQLRSDWEMAQLGPRV
ncbi:MAG TPA: DUF6456 domain-containing protein, partial [Allosphingosinicella sp.]